MAIPKNKTELLKILKTEYKKLLDEFKNIPIEKTRTKTLENDISICDLISYQIGWGTLLIDWYKKGLKNQLPIMPMEGYKWNQLGSLSKKFYSDYKNFTFYELLVLFDKTVNEIVQIIKSESNKNLYTQGIYKWTGANPRWPLGRWINVNTSSPYKSARAKIKKWKKNNN